MKISNSKKQLAKIIHENGGWVDAAEWAAQNRSGQVCPYSSKPVFEGGSPQWGVDGCIGLGSFIAKTLPNWHQTILSRDEYFHLYPAPEAAPEPVVEAKPTIEQLASDYHNRKDFADRKQQEADAAKADAEAKLAELVAAGEALGLVLSVAEPEPELVITDWRDLQEGDEIRCTEGTWDSCYIGRIGVVESVEYPSYAGDMPIRVEVDGESDWGDNFEFIRRPAKGSANA